MKKTMSERTQAWVYIGAGVVAIFAALYFMSVESSIFDWFILGMGVVSLWQGVRGFMALRGGSGGPSGPSGPSGSSES